MLPEPESKGKVEDLFGVRLHQNRTSFPAVASRCMLQGTTTNGTAVAIPLTDEDFSKHLFFLGNIGTGKTNAINQIMAQVKPKLSEQDIMIVFDSKGDFYNEFYAPGDVVISSRPEQFNNSQEYWNIFSELLLDPDDDSIRETAQEISLTLFADKIKKTNQPFFPLAAKDLFRALLYLYATESNNNRNFAELIASTSAEQLREILLANTEDGYSHFANYIPDKSEGQAAGVLAELYQLVGEIFIGAFQQDGSLSIRELVRTKGGKTIFIEYDPALGETLKPIYRLLIDLAIKEAIGRNKSKGNVWFIIDEFSLVPNLRYLDNGINFGRSQGCKFIIGLQNIPQAYHEYGEHLAQSLLSGLSTVFAFRVDDQKSRDFVQGRYGKAVKKLTYKNVTGKVEEKTESYKVIEDWDIATLPAGRCIIGFPSQEPFVFNFSKFGSKL